MTVDRRDYFPPRPAEHSTVYVTYEPSPELEQMLYEFIASDKLPRRVGKIALQSEGFHKAPLVIGGGPLEHDPAVAADIARYSQHVKMIDDATQIRIASNVEVTTLESGLKVGLNLLPDPVTAERLGSLAITPGSDPEQPEYGAFLYLPVGAAGNDIGPAAKYMESMIGMRHPSRQGRASKVSAPESRQLWVRSPRLHDRPPLRVLR